MTDFTFPVRINKYLANRGLSTRKGADELIEKGLVFVNGKKATLGQKVEKGDNVEVKGAQKEYRYALYYKPRGVITHSPAEGETDIRTKIKELYGLEGLAPIGRLDKDSEGLIILTDDGRITDRILNPKNAHVRTYTVTVDKDIRGAFLNALEHGVDIEGYKTKPAKAKRLSKRTLALSLTEGKKHQVRRMCAALGYQVTKLVRTEMENLALGDMKPGQYRLIKDTELKTFLQSIGL